MIDRQEYPTRKIFISSAHHKGIASTVLMNLPVDVNKPLLITISEAPKPRNLSQNALLWAGALKDISEQVYVNGHTFSAEVWHEYLKEKFLPDETSMSEENQHKYLKQDYKKYVDLPDGRRRLVGSTTELTVKGFALYMQEIEAWGATEHGVMYHANPNQYEGN